MRPYKVDPEKVVIPFLNDTFHLAEVYGLHDWTLPSDRERVLFQGSENLFYALAVGMQEKNLRKMSKAISVALNPQTARVLDEMVKESIKMHRGSFTIH